MTEDCASPAPQPAPQPSPFKDPAAAEALALVEGLISAAEARSATGRRLPDRSWTPANQRRFLEMIADGASVEDATSAVRLSPQSAYAFRRTARGRAFALGWRAAALVARDTIADRLLDRAMAGQSETVTRDDGSEVTRFRYDNRLATTLLRRLDRQVEEASDADTAAARMVAGEFDEYLDLVEQDAGPARAGLFLARRIDPVGDGRDLAPIHALAAADRFLRTGAGTAEEVDIADLAADARADWTAEQWRRAEAAGLVAFAPPPPPPLSADPAEALHGCQPPQLDDVDGDASDPFDDDLPVWRDGNQGWVTDYPPPEGERVIEYGTFGADDYYRTLTGAELVAWEAPILAERAALIERGRAKFAAILARRAAETAAFATSAAQEAPAVEKAPALPG